MSNFGDKNVNIVVFLPHNNNSAIDVNTANQPH